MSVLGPLLIVIYINDLDLVLSNKVSKFADDTKLEIDDAVPESVRALQRDLAVIGVWSTVGQMPFNQDKCHVLHVATANQAENYSLLSSEISSVILERHLGVIITTDLKIYQAGVPLPKQADGACPIQSIGKTAD